MIWLVEAGSAALSTVVLAHGLWWTGLSVVAVPPPRVTARTAPPKPLRLAVLVPAHNEELLIARTVASLLAAPYDPRPEIVVIADNCSDRTASVAAAAGATVLERHNPLVLGKSAALDFGLAHLGAGQEQVDAVAFVDADSSVSESFFAAIASRIGRGSAAVQVHYEAEAATEELARLRRLAFLLVHWSRPLGAGRLGLGSGIKGNGMAVRFDLLRDGLGGRGITEDAAMTLSLAERGVRVDFEPGARVTGRMATSYREAEVQDRRWEGGRFALMPLAIGAGLRALMRGDVACAAAAFDVASLPLSLLVAGAAIAAAAGLAGVGPVWLHQAAVASIAAYVASGLLAARPSPRDICSLVAAPRFLAHKAKVYASLLVRRQVAWERTARR